MPHPKKGYEVDGCPVPGVTSVVGRYKDNDKLNQWRVWCGAHGLNPTEEGRKAAMIGTAVHDAIERHIRGQAFVENPEEHYGLLSGDLEKARMCYNMWKEWNDEVKPEYVELEPQLVDGQHGYGGTLDAIAIIDDQVCVVDWKTSNGIYNETALQVSAYRWLWEQRNGWLVDGAYVLRMDKRKPTFEDYYLDRSELLLYFEQFLRYLHSFRFELEHMPVKWRKRSRAQLLKQ